MAEYFTSRPRNGVGASRPHVVAYRSKNNFVTQVQVTQVQVTQVHMLWDDDGIFLIGFFFLLSSIRLSGE